MIGYLLLTIAKSRLEEEIKQLGMGFIGGTQKEREEVRDGIVKGLEDYKTKVSNPPVEAPAEAKAEELEWANEQIVKLKAMKLDDNSAFTNMLDIVFGDITESIKAIKEAKANGQVTDEVYADYKAHYLEMVDYFKNNTDGAKAEGIFAPNEEMAKLADGRIAEAVALVESM